MSVTSCLPDVTSHLSRPHAAHTSHQFSLAVHLTVPALTLALVASMASTASAAYGTCYSDTGCTQGAQAVNGPGELLFTCFSFKPDAGTNVKLWSDGACTEHGTQAKPGTCGSIKAGPNATPIECIR